MKIRILIFSLLLIIIMALISAVLILNIDRTNETRFTIVTGKSDKETALEDEKIAPKSQSKIKKEPETIIGKNLALHKEISVKGFTQTYNGENANDGDVLSYWEGEPDTYPNIFTLDLGKEESIKIVRIKLNPDAIWEKRSQTFSISASKDNKEFKNIVESTDYSFDPESFNTVTIHFNEVKTRYVRFEFTGNTAATGGQAAEVEVY